MTYSPGKPGSEIRALVVFHGQGNGRFARFLAPGFKHCFVCVADMRGNAWIRFDGRAGLPRINAEAALDFDLAGFYRDAGFHVVNYCNPEPEAFASPFLAATCVGAVKRILGVRAPFVWTPRQLYRRLI